MMSQEVVERHSDSSHFHRIYLNDRAYLSIDEPADRKDKDINKDNRRRDLLVEGENEGTGNGESERRRETEIEREAEIPFEDMWILTRQQIEHQRDTGCLFASSPYR